MAEAAGNPPAIESDTMRRIAYQVVEMLIVRLEDPERDPAAVARTLTSSFRLRS